MAKPTPKVAAKTPVSAFSKPLNADFKGLFKALAAGIGHTTIGKWEELGKDTVDALSAVGLSTDPEELAFLLVRRALTRAIFELVGESASPQLADSKADSDVLMESLEFPSSEITIDRNFLDRPEGLPIMASIQPLLKRWLEGHGMSVSAAEAVSGRLPSYFVYALTQEWRTNPKSYQPLLDALQTPFTKAGDREWAWRAYAALLARRTEEGLFDEPFGLSELYIPLNAFYLEEKPPKHSAEDTGGPKQVRVVVRLQPELESWLEASSKEDAIRVISGGPGSGKSSFARIFAAALARQGTLKVLYVPLHLIDPSKDLVDEVGRFVRDEGILLQNPLDPTSPELHLLVIFDGLDELASQGKAAADTARAFVREVERTVERRNGQDVRLRVLLSGRELVVQENESEFRRRRQILTLLPYFVPEASEERRHRFLHNELRDHEYQDPEGILKEDLRQEWWKRYGTLSGKGFKALPDQLSRPDLDEITAQPLLNYLVALSFTRERLDFTKDINLNSIYLDLVEAVHERAYEKHRRHVQMSLENFSRVLEEIGLAAWHGDGRTTSVREIEEHCDASGVRGLLDAFKEGAKAGVTRLLAAFFFRQYGQRTSGDPTFVFTHKNFGEYLTAVRVVRAIERVVRELDQRADNYDQGWDERDALRHWVQICGPSAISPYLWQFLVNEVSLRPAERLVVWQKHLARLFTHALRHGMPMELLQTGTFRQSMFQSRNAEEALLVALNACARVTKELSKIEHPDVSAFGAWFRRIQGQRTSGESCLAANCLSYLNLAGITLDISDLYAANLEGSNLRGVQAHYACLAMGNLANSDWSGAVLWWANLRDSNLAGVNFTDASLGFADLHGGQIQRIKTAVGAHVHNVVPEEARQLLIKAGGSERRAFQGNSSRMVAKGERS